MGAFPFFILMRGSSRASASCPCGYKCPCHNEKWYDTFWGVGLCVCSGMLMLVFVVLTFLNWIDSSAQTTLLQTVANEWHWLTALLHRIW
jgi:hypothetical protein